MRRMVDDEQGERQGADHSELRQDVWFEIEISGRSGEGAKVQLRA